MTAFSLFYRTEITNVATHTWTAHTS